MTAKKLIIATMLILAFIFFASMTEDCFTPFHISVTGAQEQFEQDMDWCADNAFPFFGKCENEADAAMNATIDNALDEFTKCCCRNGLICCIG